MTALYPDIPEVLVEEKAEDKYVSVAAASVVAKVLRDGLQESISHHLRGEAEK